MELADQGYYYHKLEFLNDWIKHLVVRSNHEHLHTTIENFLEWFY